MSSEYSLDSHDEENAIINWINSFGLNVPCNTISDLIDGKIISLILLKIDEDYFKFSDLSSVSTTNIKKILSQLQNYYEKILVKGIDTSIIDVSAITRKCDLDEIISLFELVLGCAVLCENKAYFIQNIFSLDHTSQTILQEMVQSAMGRTFELNVPAQENVENELDSQEIFQVKEMNKFLLEERQKLSINFEKSEKDNLSLKQQVEALQNKLNLITQESETNEGIDRDRLNNNSSLTFQLQTQLDDAKRELDLKNVEIENLQNDFQLSVQRYESSKAIQTKLDLEMQRMADELDLARDTAKRLAVAESNIEKYQKKISDFNALKKQNKDLESKLEEYLDKIQEMESGNKNILIMTKKIEQYKNENIVLDREKIEALSALGEQQKHCEILSQELKSANEAKKALENDLDRLKMELELITEREAEKEHETLNSSGGLGSVELIEKVKLLEIELRKAKEASVSSDTSVAGDSSSKENVDSQPIIELLQNELDAVKNQKKEREDALLASKKQIVELQAELNKTNRAYNEIKETSVNDQASVSNSKELESQLSQKLNTIRVLEEKLKEKESLINRLEQDKNKLENYSKQALTTFKDKYIQALQKLKSEKKQLEENVNYLKSKSEKDQETHRREERLIISSMYEVGLRIMDKNIQAQVQSTSQSPTTFLGTQRADQDKKLLTPKP